MMANIPLKQQTSVQAGKLEDTVKSITSWFKKAISRLVDLGLTVDPNVTYDDFGNEIFKIETGGGNHMLLKLKDLSKESKNPRPGFFAIKAYREDDRSVETDTVIIKAERMDDAITAFIDELFEESVEKAEDRHGNDAVHSSARINIQLKRITGDNVDEIVVDKVCANCDTTLAKQLLNSALYSDELTNTIPEECALYTVVDDGSGTLDVQPCEDILEGCTNPILILLGQAIRLRDGYLVNRWNNPESTNWDDITYQLSDECDFWGRLYVEQVGRVCPEISDILKLPETELCSTDGLRGQLAIHTGALEMFLGNFEVDVQVLMTNYIRMYKKYKDYLHR